MKRKKFVLSFSKEDLILLDSLVENQMFSCAKVLNLSRDSSDEFRYVSVSDKFKRLYELSLKIEASMKTLLLEKDF